MKITQRTIKQSIQVSGIGLHSGDKVSMVLKPADENSGIVFVRTDLTPPQEIKINPSLVKETTLCTGLVSNSGTRVQTIEHLMAAISSFGIDNLIIELDSPEIPIMDGSSVAFVTLLQEVGIKNQSEAKYFIRVLEKVRVEEGDKYAELLPIDSNKFLLDFTIDFNHPVFSSEHSNYKMFLNTTNFIEQLSRARTFGFLKDIEYLQANGLCRGGSLSNAIVLDNVCIINEEGLRFPDEFVRHKMLDAIGDLYLCNHNLIGHYVAYKSGHALNNQLIRKLLATESAYEIVSFENLEQMEQSSMLGQFGNEMVTA